jgi:hypothetical protein
MTNLSVVQIKVLLIPLALVEKDGLTADRKSH